MITGLDSILKQLDPNRLKDAAVKASQAYGNAIVRDAQTTAPANESKLRQSIKVDLKQIRDELIIDVQAGVSYAAYMEFGTGKQASSYVGTLPDDWQKVAKEYKDKGSGTFEDMVASLTNWVNKKNITGTYSIKTRKRTGSKAKIQMEDEQMARLIAFSILKKGLRPRRFMYLAVTYNRKEFDNEFNRVYLG